MEQIFVDTDGWLALNRKREELHELAVEMNQQLLEDGHRYLTSNYILDETYPLLSRWAGRAIAIDFGEKVQISKTTDIIHITETITEIAWEYFKKYADHKEISFTDCTSHRGHRRRHSPASGHTCTINLGSSKIKII